MEVVVTAKALKQYNSLSDPDRLKIKKRMKSLEDNPLLGKLLSGSFSEVRSLKAWPYRILYYIDLKNKKIYVITVAHRQGVYKS
jgi:mRNA-degrading endonuclease RelE of RelBE toxin-antitoxin system